MIRGGARSQPGGDAPACPSRSHDESAALANDFRLAMRRIATTVTIITAGDGQGHYGVTATSVTSVAMSPPALLVCLNRQGTLYSRLAPVSSFCVNVLRKGQEHLSRAFSGGLPHDERFSASGDWLDDGGLPFLRDAQCAIFCETARTLDWGTHAIIVGAVRKVRVGSEVVPLLYCDGGFRELGCVPELAAD